MATDTKRSAYLSQVLSGANSSSILSTIKFMVHVSESESHKNQAKALYTFPAEKDGDFDFKKGDIITMTKAAVNRDWFTGKIGECTGEFPR
jgi:hypothetical protein